MRCITWKEVASSALPPKPKITPEVCIGRMRPKVDQGVPKVRSGQASIAATQTPSAIPTTAQASDSTMPTLVGSS